MVNVVLIIDCLDGAVAGWTSDLLTWILDLLEFRGSRLAGGKSLVVVGRCWIGAGELRTEPKMTVQKI